MLPNQVARCNSSFFNSIILIYKAVVRLCVVLCVCYNDFSKMGKDFHKLFSLWASPIHEVDAWSVVKRSEYLPYSHSSFFNKRRRERRREEEVREIVQDPLCCDPRHNHKWLNRLDA